VRHDACIGVLFVELGFPGSRSLKDKRAPLASLCDMVHARFRASFSEVGHNDVWQRARVLIVLAASSLKQARERLDEVERYLFGQEYEVARVLLKTTDPLGALWEFDS
jgi:uncharacterized protein